MMTIRSGQLQAFDGRRAQVREQKLAEYARARFPGRFDSRTSEDMSKFCTAVRQLATDLCVNEEPDVATVLDLAVMYGMRFSEAEWASDVFAVSDWSGAEKMRVIRSRVRRQVPEF